MKKVYLWVLALWFVPGFLLAATPWENYLKNPTSENARRVKSIEHPQGEDEKEWKQLDDGLKLLEKQMLSGDREAVNLALRLRSQSDGYISEDLNNMFGRLVRVQPKLFLETISKHPDQKDDLEVWSTVLSEEFADKYHEQIQELNERIKALETITDPKLAAIRDECIALIQKEIVQINAAEQNVH